MYVPTSFDEQRPEVLQDLIRRYPLALLVANTSSGLDANHIPLMLQTDIQGKVTLQGHLARANSFWKQVASQSEVLTIFQGPNQYISPNWYASKQEHGQVVPTWNYVVVHVHGKIVWHDNRDWLARMLDELTNLHESTQANPWRMSDAPRDYLDKMMQAVVGLEIVVERMIGKWKVSQNREPIDRASVIDHLEKSRKPDEVVMAELIRGHGPLT